MVMASEHGRATVGQKRLSVWLRLISYGKVQSNTKQCPGKEIIRTTGYGMGYLEVLGLFFTSMARRFEFEETEVALKLAWTERQKHVPGTSQPLTKAYWARGVAHDTRALQSSKLIDRYRWLHVS